jgi:hypothetical protein
MRDHGWTIHAFLGAAFATSLLSGCGTMSGAGNAHDGGPTGSTCSTSVDLTMLTLPDAGSVASCYACATASCGSELGACNDECLCQSLVPVFAQCLTMETEKFGECLAFLSVSPQAAGTALGDCLVQKCSPQCTPRGDAGVGSCPAGKDISKIAPLSAALGNAGATVGGCVACAETSCRSQLGACTADCPCATSAPAFVACLATESASPQDCKSLIENWLDMPSVQLVDCLGQSCRSQCCTQCL